MSKYISRTEKERESTLRERRAKPQQMDLVIPEDHLLRKIDNAVDFGFIHDLCAPLYCTDPTHIKAKANTKRSRLTDPIHRAAVQSGGWKVQQIRKADSSAEKENRMDRITSSIERQTVRIM